MTLTANMNEPHACAGTTSAATPAADYDVESKRSMRIALYSHDTMGVGHMRRNLLIAESLTQTLPDTTVLMLAGAKEANAFAVPKGIDCLTLPGLFKDIRGGYHSRSLRVRLSEVIRVRSAAIRAAVEAFQPDLFIVDKVPRGVADELIPTLESLRDTGTTRCVLGLREVLDEKSVTLESWRTTRTADVIRAYFDAVWVYGDPRVFDLVREYELPHDIAARVRFTGYLDQRQRTTVAADPPEFVRDLADEPFVLCALGGGQDGVPLARAFVEAALSSGRNAVLVTGPFMPQEACEQLLCRAAGHPELRILNFVHEADWLVSRAERVVAMGGYNTVCSILSFQKPALIVPRIRPRSEQLVRASRLRDLGLVEMLHPSALSCRDLREWITSPTPRVPNVHQRIDLNGLKHIRRLVEELIPESWSSQHATS